MSQRPPPQTSDDVRRAFHEFFAERGHVQQPSSSLVPYNDPSVLLTTAGMQQMIPYMLGRERPPAVRMTSTQKCFRTGDIDEVGNPRNLTFFEMLGNFSIGDYFKAEAIAWAWELVTEWFRLPAERVLITVHPTDDEAVELWLRHVPRERISFLEDNWWGPPGAEGPCGPDSELYYDLGEAVGCGKPDCAPGCDCDRYLEFWNLVFMQYYQDRAGTRTPLAMKNIDTGMGLERMTAVIQGVRTVYETDLYVPIIERVSEVAGTSGGRDGATGYALRVIADHARGMTFLAADGVLPGNEGRGYVMRRIIRRAVRYGRLLGIDQPFLERIVERVVERMRGGYPELEERRGLIIETVRDEEARFAETLAAGTERLVEWIERAKAAGEARVAGDLLFQLYDTFGFPRELSEEILAEAGLEADREGFDRAMAAQRARSRAGARFAGVAELEAYDVSDVPPSEFLGYERLGTPGTVLAMREDGRATAELREGQGGLIVLDQTAFYPEGGGQVGDRGAIRGRDGLFRVTDTKRIDESHIAHVGVVEEGVLRNGMDVSGEVDRAHRQETARHHTLTHILHRTLKDVLGENTEQKGSLVAPHVARFDFNYPRGLDREQLEQVNAAINRHILEDLPVAWQVMDVARARRSGAVAIFGEKYGSQVRVVDIGGWSKELCGGTHVPRSADVGTAMLVRESGLASGIRRVEVLAGETAFAHAWQQQERLVHLARTLGAPVDQLEAKLAALIEELDQARRERARLAQQLAGRRADQLVNAAVDVDGVKVLAARVDVATRDALRDMADQLRAKLGRSVVALAAEVSGQNALVVGASRDATEAGLNAGQILRDALAAAGGKGGGRPDFAQGGVKEPSQLGVALAQVVPLVRRALELPTDH
jgi:alanyl-tRNA synthetase